MTFVTPVTLNIKVTTPKQKGFLRGLRESYIRGMKFIAVELFELSCGNGSVFRQTGGRTEGRTDRWTDSGIT